MQQYTKSYSYNGIAYHSTENKPFKQFNTDAKFQFGAHFATSKETANNRVTNRLITVSLNINNPLYFSDLGDWTDLEMWQEYLNNYEVFEEEQIKNLGTVYDIRAALESIGYDGVVYENRFESNDKLELSYIAFYPNQITILN